ncbi:hypothetical protein VNO78_22699 [Psophocarpus tetragonolobus]|uniref:Uncharacterized protein n=1 Tax=Psophocarpus tetragonolobus TaxID=3891 RepID=A0AAN9XD07_PSOTE
MFTIRVVEEAFTPVGRGNGCVKVVGSRSSDHNSSWWLWRKRQGSGGDGLGNGGDGRGKCDHHEKCVPRVLVHECGAKRKSVTEVSMNPKNSSILNSESHKQGSGEEKPGGRERSGKLVEVEMGYTRK